MREVTFLLFLGVLDCCMLCGGDQFIQGFRLSLRVPDTDDAQQMNKNIKNKYPNTPKVLLENNIFLFNVICVRYRTVRNKMIQCLDLCRVRRVPIRPLNFKFVTQIKANE